MHTAVHLATDPEPMTHPGGSQFAICDINCVTLNWNRPLLFKILKMTMLLKTFDFHIPSCASKKIEIYAHMETSRPVKLTGFALTTEARFCHSCLLLWASFSRQKTVTFAHVIEAQCCYSACRLGHPHNGERGGV